MSQGYSSDQYGEFRTVENAWALTSWGDEANGEGNFEGVERPSVGRLSPVIEEPWQPSASLNPLIAQPNKQSTFSRRRKRLKSQNTSSHGKLGFASQNTSSTKKLFGLNRSVHQDTQSHSASTFNRFDYEQKYPKDRFGEELGPNARVWLTYLDEADTYDHDKVEGWRDTVDVLLVFTGLFSAIVTTFLSQSSQSLQQDFTQVSASLLFEMVQLQRAQFAGAAISSIPNSTLTPTSQFNPSSNASLVNGLWFASLTVSLSTALFSVLAKQWLYYYMAAVPGTARDKARVRQFRFQGLESWKVGFIIDLLPILLHLAVGLYLVGLIILVLPLDIQIAWVVLVLSGITYALYFVSVALPVWYTKCPYTTSLTTFMGTVYHLLVSMSFVKRSRWRGHKHPYITKNFALANHLVWLLESSVRNTGRVISSLILPVQRRILGPTENLRQHLAEATRWREIKLNESIRTTDWLNLKAFHWLHVISPNPSIQRIIARSLSVYPDSIEKSGLKFSLYNIFGREAGVEDNSHDLALKIRDKTHRSWMKEPLTFLAGALVDKEEQSYSCIKIARRILQDDYVGILREAFDDPRFRAPFMIWRYLLSSAETDALLVARILQSCVNPFFNPFAWDEGYDPTSDGSSLIDCTSEKLGVPFFEYLFRCFCGNELPTDEPAIFSENHYRLFLAIYRNLTSDQPVIQNHWILKDCLGILFSEVSAVICDADRDGRPEPWKYLRGFSKDVLFDDAFRGERMTDPDAVNGAMGIFDVLWKRDSEDTGDVLHFFSSADNDQKLRYVYRWISQQNSEFLFNSIVLPLFVPQNLKNLTTILLDGPREQAISDFCCCLRRLRSVSPDETTTAQRIELERRYIFPHLGHLFKTMSHSDPLFSILHDKLVLVQLWTYFSERDNTILTDKDFVDIIKLKLQFNSQDLEELYECMVSEALTQAWEIVPYKSAYRFGRMIGVPVSHFTSCAAAQWTDLQMRPPRAGWIPPRVGIQRFQSAAEMFEAFDWELDREPDKEERKCSHSLPHLIDRVGKIIKNSLPLNKSNNESVV